MGQIKQTIIGLGDQIGLEEVLATGHGVDRGEWMILKGHLEREGFGKASRKARPRGQRILGPLWWVVNDDV